MVWRALTVWFAIVVLANINGAVREFWLVPQLGQTAGRAASTLILCGLILLLTWLTIEWIRPTTGGESWGIGGLWLGLTLAFEFLGGHFVFRKPWPALLEDYDVSRGRIWILVLITVLLAPFWSARGRRLP